MEIKPIAYIKSDFKEKFGVPRQSGRAEELTAEIVFEQSFCDKDFFREIEGFEYLWLIFDFSLAHRAEISPLVRPPRLGGNKRVGVFASRSPFRPNNLGLSSVRLLKVVNKDGAISLVVGGADLVNGTPIYDVKPYLPFTDSHENARAGYAEDFENYKLKVEFADGVEGQIAKEKLSALVSCLSDDPRPSYQDDGREYGMTFAEYNVKFRVDGDTLIVFDIEKSQV